MKKRLCAALCCLMLPSLAYADLDQQDVWKIYDESGAYLTSVAGAVYPQDEYISAGNQCYILARLDEANQCAYAHLIGAEQMPEPVKMSRSLYASIFGGNQRKLALYCTHSDESYVPTDGTHSNEVYGGIYDVTESLKKELENLGIEVILDYTSHLPHDAGAYRRSRTTAISLLKKGPSAVFDIHRDGVAAHEYETRIEGEDASMVRLLVGKSNVNAQANREFAKTIKAIADETYPGLIKDIYIGKGDYNQDLSPRSVLLEFGTHENSKELPLTSTKYIAQVLSLAVFGDTGESAQQQNAPGASRAPNPQTTQLPSAQSSKGLGSGLLWVLGLGIGGGLIYLLLVKGRTHFGSKVSRSVSEMTGGMVGKKPDDADEDSSDASEAHK